MLLRKFFILLTLLASAGFSSADTVLITGANRGIGLEFARYYAEKGYDVIATARKPEKAEALQVLANNNKKVTIEALDVTDHAAIDALAKKYADQPIDILLNNAGISGGSDNQKFGSIDYTVYAKVMAVNVFGPLKMAEAFIDNVKASEQKKIIAVSSSMGSIKKTFGRLFIYRSSKSALNMAYATLAKEQRKKIIVGLVNPGPTDTDMMKGLNPKMLRSPKLAVKDMARNIEELNFATSGAFLQYDGSTLPW